MRYVCSSSHSYLHRGNAQVQQDAVNIAICQAVGHLLQQSLQVPASEGHVRVVACCNMASGRTSLHHDHCEGTGLWRP